MRNEEEIKNYIKKLNDESFNGKVNTRTKKMKMIKQEELVSELTNYIGYVQTEHFKKMTEEVYNTTGKDTELLIDNVCDTIELIIAEFGGNRVLNVVEIADEFVEYCEDAQSKTFGKFVELIK